MMSERMKSVCRDQKQVSWRQGSMTGSSFISMADIRIACCEYECMIVYYIGFVSNMLVQAGLMILNPCKLG